MAFSPDEVESLTAYQHSVVFHPFTCGTKEKHTNDSDSDILQAESDGWHCVSCYYYQDWAHEWMKDWSWKRHSPWIKFTEEL